MHEEKYQETTVLTDEEKRKFDGITIDESTQDPEESPKIIDDFGYENENPYGERVRIKVFSLHDISWPVKILMGLAFLALLVLSVFLGGFILIGMVALGVIGIFISILRQLFS